MNIKNQIKVFFTKDWPGKLASLIIATILWFVISLSQSTVTNYPGQLKINFTNLKDGLIAISNDDYVQIKINTKPVNLRDVKESDFKIQIDLDSLGEGTYEKNISVVSSNSNVQIVSVTPQKTTVRIEKKISKTVPVRVRLDGQVAEGLIASDAKTDPPEVAISGPESIINSITEVVAPIKLDGEKDDFVRTAQLFAYTAQGVEIKNILISSDSVKVSVIISSSGETKTVGIKVDTSGEIASGYWISSITTDPQVLTIIGSASKVAQTKYLETEAIDIGSLTQSKTFSSKISIPAGVTVQDKPQSIKIVVNIDKVLATKSFDITANFMNLPSSLAITQSQPATVKVEITSDGKDVESLNSQDIKLNLDLSSATESTTEIGIDSSKFEIPSGYRISSISDSKITLKIAKK
jgi:YbbR domain-containing protein